MTIKEFMDQHFACHEGRAWAENTCKTMDDVWRLARPDWLVWVATRRGVLTDRELRIFAVWSARQVQHLITDARSLAALDVAERHAKGQATDQELAAARAEAGDAARDAAWDAAWAAASDAAGAAAGDAAGDAARAAAGAAARAAARAEAGDAARAEAGDAARDAAWDAAWDAQAEWLRSNTSPRWEVSA
jgi:hypothetical protein